MKLGDPGDAGPGAVTVAEFERAMEATRSAHEALASMAEAVGTMAEAVGTMADSFRLAADRPGPDAARWRPDSVPEITPDTPVRHCPLMFREEEHAGHPDTDLSGGAVQCPGYPLPSITDLLPDCETGDDRTCTESCPLHG
jgi:hypothetical protein